MIACLQAGCQCPWLSTVATQRNSPLGAAESEAVGQLSTERFPESRLVFIFQLEELVVVVLHLLMFLGDLGAITVVTVVPPAATTTATSTAAPASASTSATLQKLAA